MMQLCKNYVILKLCIDQKFNANVIKATHRRRKRSLLFPSLRGYLVSLTIYLLQNIYAKLNMASFLVHMHIFYQ